MNILKRNTWTLFGSPNDTCVLEVYDELAPTVLASYWTLGLDEYGTPNPFIASHWSADGQTYLGECLLAELF